MIYVGLSQIIMLAINDCNDIITIIIGKPNPATNYVYNQVQNECEEGTAVSVNISWSSPDNADEVILQLQSMNYNTTVHSRVNSVTKLLPRGIYSVSLCTRNRCGQFCQNYSNMEIDCNSQLETKSGKDRSVLQWNL